MSETARNLLIFAGVIILIWAWVAYDLRKINKDYDHYKKTGKWRS